MTSDDDVHAAATMLRELANAGLLDRTFQIKVGTVEVNLGPADMDTAMAAMPEADPRKKIMMHLLGRGRELGNVG